MATLTDLLKKVKKTIKDYTPLDEAVSSVSSYFDPTSNQGQNFWSTPVAQKLGEIQQRYEQVGGIRYFSLPHAMASGKLATGIEPLDFLTQNIGAYMKNAWVEPALQIPSNIKQIVEGQTSLEKAKGAGKLALNVLSAVPDPTEIPIAIYNLAKGISAARLRGEKGRDVLKSALSSVTLEETPGLGEALSTNSTEKTVGNIAELPLMLLAGRIKSKNIDENTKLISRAIKEGKITPEEGQAMLKDLAKRGEKIKLKVKQEIPPEIEPLAEEARKYKSVEEFVKNFPKIFDDLIERGIIGRGAKYDSYEVGQSLIKQFGEGKKGLINFYNQATGIKEAQPTTKVKTEIPLGLKGISLDEFAKVAKVNRGEGYISVTSPYDNTSFIIRTIETSKISDAEAIAKSYADYVRNGSKLVAQAQHTVGGSQIGTVQSSQKTKGKLPKEEPQANIPSQTNAYTNIVSSKVKKGEPPTPDEVGKSIEERLNAFTEKVLGYNPQDIQGGQKGASFFTGTLRKGQEAISTTLEKGLASQFTPVRLASQLLEGFFRGIGMSPERAQASATLRGGMNLAQERSFNIGQALYDLLGRDEKSLARINAVLDPELTKTKISFNDLTPQEKQVYNLIREGLDLVHDISYASGFLSPEKYLANKGKYTPRLYEPMELPPEVNEFVKQSTKKLNFDIFKKRKDVDDWKIENSLNNPVYGLAKRLSQVQMNMEVKKYIGFLASNSRYVSDTPRAGFTKLSESPVYGKLSGKYVLNSAAEDLKGFFFSNELMQKLYDVFRVYDRLPLRQLQKKLLTVFNPTTNVGNIVSDTVFGFVIGVDPLTLNKNILELKKNPKEFRKLADYLMSKNIIGTDITRTDFVSQLAKVDELANIGVKQKLKDVASKVERFYGGTDDVYKIAAFKALLNKGYSLEEATRLVADGFQNYSNVGKFYDLWSKTPVIGEPFIKFQGDLIRIIKNAAINRPLHLITFLATLKGIAYLFSKLSKESDEDRITREQRYGAPYIPGLNIPLTWQTPWGEINVARYISPTFANRDTSTLMGRMLPFTPEMSQYGKDNTAFIAQNISDPLVAPLIHGLVLNRDFRGKPIADPNETKYKPSTLTDEEKLANVAAFIARGYTPPPINSAIDVVSAFQGKPNMYGAKQTPAQAMARLFGVKIQKFGPEEAQQQREKDLEFSVKHNEFIDKQINSVYKQLLNKEITQEQADRRIENLEKQKKALHNVFQSGDKIRLLDKDGKLKIIDLSFQPTPPVLTGNTELDKKAISKFNSEITKKANDIYDLYQAGKISAQEAEQELLRLKELKELKAKTGKVKVGGKTIKIASPQTLKIKQIKPAKIKTTSLMKVRIARPRSIRTLKIAKPKTQTVRIRIPKQTYQPIPIKLGSN